MIVEFTDPSGVFPLIAHDLNQRLPLRNLHWNSSSRPLRSISFLHIELVPDSKLVSEDSSIRSTPGTSNQVKDDELASDTASASKTQAPASEELGKERRHQIPGLRQTPYLKIYLLRCGDTESYKATSRKLLREWINNHTPPSQSSTSTNKKENHDAFEWLIVHVVLPGDNASVSRLSGNTKSDSRWPTRSSASLIEKIRVDFNGTSKNAMDRVAQVKATESSDGSKVSSRPTPFINQSSEVEGHRGWDDLAAKLKSLILASFDLRVSQYEEDIREKESQRKLPGWNFNTFFLLKEGLARGFESVGLVEDALTSYHELAAGLYAVIRERQTEEFSQQHTGLFRDHTEEVLEEFKRAALSESISRKLNHESEYTSVGSAQILSRADDFGASILDTGRKPFRELILANNISAFDFQCYVFARQILLLLRLANVVSLEGSFTLDPAINGTFKESDMASGAESVSDHAEPRNLPVLAEICRRGLEFVTSAACALRDDFGSSIKYDSQKCGDYDFLSKARIDNIIESLLASWIFSASQCILKKTFTQSLSCRIEPLLRQLKPDRPDEKDTYEKSLQLVDVVRRDNLPSRTSSLPSRTPPTKHSSSPERFPSVTFLDAIRLLPPTSLQTGFQELAAQRAELLSLARRALSSLGTRIGGWSSGWADLASVLLSSGGAMEDVSINDELGGNLVAADGKMHPKDHRSSSITGAQNKALFSAVSSKSAFYEAYEVKGAGLAPFEPEMLIEILGSNSISTRTLCSGRKAQIGRSDDRRHCGGAIVCWKCLFDTKRLTGNSYLKDYAAAASYFHQLAPFYAEGDWSHLEMSVLEMYVQCLRRLDRNEEYINTALQILGKIVQRSRTVPQRQRLGDATGHLGNLISASKSLDRPVSIPVDNYFENIRLDPFIRHHERHDGFQLLLRFKNLMPDSFQAQQIRARIVTVETEQRYEIWLAAQNIENVEPGSVKVLLESSVRLPSYPLCIWILTL